VVIAIMSLALNIRGQRIRKFGKSDTGSGVGYEAAYFPWSLGCLELSDPTHSRSFLAATTA
jgi:hypothetical protein